MVSVDVKPHVSFLCREGLEGEIPPELQTEGGAVLCHLRAALCWPSVGGDVRAARCWPGGPGRGEGFVAGTLQEVSGLCGQPLAKQHHTSSIAPQGGK